MNWKRKLYPVPARRLVMLVRNVIVSWMIIPVIDFLDRRRGLTSPLVPPSRRLANINGTIRGTLESCDKEMRWIIDYAGVKPTDHVLDVGCGGGFKMVPLTRHLKEGGRYDGIDILPGTIAWLQENVTPRFPAFRFTYADVYSNLYNRSAPVRAAEYVFPYETETFDFVFLISVFTHMFPEDMERYLSEISRVMKVGGKCLISYFLLNEESARAVEEGRSSQDFRFEMEGYRTISTSHPLDAVAYPEDSMRKLYERLGLSIREPITYGFWPGRADRTFYQDVILATRIR